MGDIGDGGDSSTSDRDVAVLDGFIVERARVVEQELLVSCHVVGVVELLLDRERAHGPGVGVGYSDLSHAQVPDRQRDRGLVFRDDDIRLRRQVTLLALAEDETRELIAGDLRRGRLGQGDLGTRGEVLQLTSLGQVGPGRDIEDAILDGATREHDVSVDLHRVVRGDSVHTLDNLEDVCATEPISARCIRGHHVPGLGGCGDLLAANTCDIVHNVTVLQTIRFHLGEHVDSVYTRRAGAEQGDAHLVLRSIPYDVVLALAEQLGGAGDGIRDKVPVAASIPFLGAVSVPDLHGLLVLGFGVQILDADLA